ncbi:mitogen-activated protein kinase kinase kinase, partial [Exophiala xenobiotica]
MLKVSGPGRGGPGNPEATYSGRFYADRRDAQETARPSPLDTHRTWSNDYPPGGKDQNKGFLSKFMRKRHEHSQPALEDHPLESPTSPGGFRFFSKPSANGSDLALQQRPASTSVVSADEKAAYPMRRGNNPPRRYIFVTPDSWNYRLVDVTEVESAVALRSLICIELGIADAEYAQIFLTEPGQSEHEIPLSDNALVSLRGRTDNSGSLKLFVQSPTLSAVSGPSSTGLGVLFAQREQTEAYARGAPMVKSNSAGGVNRNGYVSAPSSALDQPSADTTLLQKQADEYRRQTEVKHKAYLESRRAQKEQGTTYNGGGIRGSTVIDFDSPRLSPFEDKKVEPLVPVRRPPTAPSESTTLTKVNSLRARGSGTRSSLDALKRISDPIAEEEANRVQKKSSSSAIASGGIGAALANVGRMAGAPASVGSQGIQQDRNRGPQGVDFSQRGYGSFPEPRQRTSAMDSMASSREISPSGDAARPVLQTRKSYGPDFDSEETNVLFAPSPNPFKQTDSDDDSDDGLFAIPLTNKSLPKGVGQATGNKDQRPALTVDTDHHAGKN